MTCPLAATAGMVPAVLAVLEYSPPCLPQCSAVEQGLQGRASLSQENPLGAVHPALQLTILHH